MVRKGPNGIQSVNLTEPVAIDNSGAIARLEVKPQSFRTPITTFKDMAVKYVAFDFDGNVAICEINITVVGKCTFNVLFTLSLNTKNLTPFEEQYISQPFIMNKQYMVQ